MIPYVTLIRWGFALALLALVCGGLVKCGYDKGVASSQADVATRDATIAELRVLVAGAASALDAVNRQAAEDLAASEEKQRQADFAKERALMAADDLRRELEQTEKDLADAMRDPGCRAELEKPTCAVLR